MSLVDVFDTIGSNKWFEIVFLYFIYYFLFQCTCGFFSRVLIYTSSFSSLYGGYSWSFLLGPLNGHYLTNLLQNLIYYAKFKLPEMFFIPITKRSPGLSLCILLQYEHISWYIPLFEYFSFVCWLCGRPRRRKEDNIKMDLQEVGWETWTGLIWLRIGTGGGRLWMR